MVEIITKAVSKSTLKDVVDKLINEKIQVEITQQVKKIYPIQKYHQRVNTIKRPRFDISQLLYMQSDEVIGSAEKTEEKVIENLIKT
jgi:ribosomal protein S3AE